VHAFAQPNGFSLGFSGCPSFAVLCRPAVAGNGWAFFILRGWSMFPSSGLLLDFHRACRRTLQVNTKASRDGC
jgi:hypothetical protein